jgi:uncharacterized phage protein (TIGR02218 family)
MSFLRTPQNVQSPYTSASLPAHYAGTTLTICACAKVTSPIDGSVVAFTTWSRDLRNVPGYSGVVFKTTTGMSASNVEVQQGQNAGNMEADLFLLAAGITEADALAGKWTHAETIIFVANYQALGMGQYITHKGHLGQFVQKGKMLSVEIMGLNACLVQTYGKTTRGECSRTFCDGLCTLTIADFTVTGSLTSVTDQNIFADSSRSEGSDTFGNGEFLFTSGQNSGYRFKIDSFASGLFGLRTPTPYLPQVGDTYSAVYGCRKRPSDCKTRVKIDTTPVNNILNTDAMEWIPIIEDLNRLPLQ